VVRGTIVRYEDDVALAYTGGAAGQTNSVEVTKRGVELTVNIEITDQRTGAVLWTKSGLTVRGDYSGQSIADGLHKALDMLANNIVEGAQSQW
jgi:outer membrane receptor protein involved in Fe transport